MNEKQTHNDNSLEDYKLLQETKNLRTAKSTLYVSKKTQYEDAGSSAIVLVVMGGIGFLLAILSLLHIISIPFMSTTYSQVTMLIMFTIFLALGVHSWIKAKKVQSLISDEEEASDNISTWLKENITLEKLDELEDSSVSSEINYLAKLDYLNQVAKQQFPTCSEEQIEFLVDEFLNSFFE